MATSSPRTLCLNMSPSPSASQERTPRPIERGRRHSRIEALCPFRTLGRLMPGASAVDTPPSARGIGQRLRHPPAGRAPLLCRRELPDHYSHPASPCPDALPLPQTSGALFPGGEGVERRWSRGYHDAAPDRAHDGDERPDHGRFGARRGSGIRRSPRRSELAPGHGDGR